MGPTCRRQLPCAHCPVGGINQLRDRGLWPQAAAYYRTSNTKVEHHIQDKPSRNAILLLIQEIKRDLIYRRMNLPPSAQQVTDPRRLAAHVDSTIRRLRSYLQYIGLMKYKKADDLLSRLQECNLA